MHEAVSEVYKRRKDGDVTQILLCRLMYTLFYITVEVDESTEDYLKVEIIKHND